MDSVRRYREQAWPWPVHLAALGFAGFGVLLFALATYRIEQVISVGTIVAFVGLVVWDFVRCRRVALDPSGFAIGAQHFAWTDIEQWHFRDGPLARAGLFLRLREDARQRAGLLAPTHRDHGLGLGPAPTPEVAAMRYDFFLRARDEQLVEWHELVQRWTGYGEANGIDTERLDAAVRQVSQLTRSIVRGADEFVELIAAASVQAAVLFDDANGITIELRAPTIEALFNYGKGAILNALPSDVRVDPAFARGIMIFVGPVEMARHPRSNEALAHIRAEVQAGLPGTPRTIAAMYASRQ